MIESQETEQRRLDLDNEAAALRARIEAAPSHWFHVRRYAEGRRHDERCRRVLEILDELEAATPVCKEVKR